MSKRAVHHWAFAILLAILQIVFIYSLFSNWGYDDAFITFRYAENLYQGQGFVYNPGERVLSTTTPLFTLLLSGLRHFASDLPGLAVLIGTLSLPIGGLFLWDLSYTLKQPLTAWFSLLLYPIFPLLLNTLSSETPLFLTLCLGTLAFYARSRYSLAAGFIALGILTRPEALLITFLLTLHFVIAERKYPPTPAVLAFTLILSPWLLFSTLYFGSPVPATLAAKQAQGTMAISQRFAPGLLTIVQSGYTNRWQYWLLSALASMGFFSILQFRQRNWWLLVGWSIAHFLTLTLLGVTSYFWYYTPLVPGFLVLVGLGTENLSDILNSLSLSHTRITRLLCMACMLLLGLLVGKHAIERSEFPDPRLSIYQAIGEWIRSNTKQTESVGTLEVGIIGYSTDRRMIDFAGIIQPFIAEQLTQGTTYEDSAIWAIKAYQPEIIVFNPDGSPRLKSDIIDTNCTSVETFRGVEYGYPGDLLVLQCKW